MKLDFAHKLPDAGTYLAQLKGQVSVSSFPLIAQNNFYFGDNLLLLSAMFQQGLEVDCIYIDPPFATNSVFIDKHGNEAYSDKMVLDEFLAFLQPRLFLAHDLLKDSGFLWVHIDQKMNHYVKALCDEIFGFNNFVVDIITARVKKNHTNSKNFNIANDNLLVYRKSPHAVLHPLYKSSTKKPYWHAFDAKGQGVAKIFNGISIVPPAGTHWRWSQLKIDQAMQAKTMRLNKNNKPEYLVTPSQQKIDSNWTDIPGYSFKTGYPTEKNVEILKRVISASTNPGDLVMDFFAGSGVTAVAAKTLGRSFIISDKGQQASKIIANRLNLSPTKLCP